MAKRFTDTDKWKKPFIRGLQGAYKLLWLYILDDCDHAGIWQVDEDVAKIRINEDIDFDKAAELFSGHIQIFDNNQKWFIQDFIDFQYGELNPLNRVHLSIINIHKKYKIKPLVSPLYGAKDKDKDKDMDKDKEQVSEIIDYLNQKCQTNFKSSSDKTQKLIKARLNDGFTIEDFKTVIDKKYSEWKNDPKMASYIRPETFFGTKFESYLNQKTVLPIKKHEESNTSKYDRAIDTTNAVIAKLTGND